MLSEPEVNKLSIDDIVTGTYTILGEARTQTYQGQLAIAYVIINRLHRPNYFMQSSIRGVCRAPLQFSVWNNSADKNLEITVGIPMSSMQFMVAMNALLTAITGTESDPTNGADHYHTTKKPDYAQAWPPKWANLAKKTAIIGAHTFYKLANE